MKFYNYLKDKYWLVGVLVLIWCGSGCILQRINSTSDVTTATRTVSVAPSSTISLPLASTITMSPTETVLLTETLEFMTTPTLTSMPTLSPEKALDALLALYANNGGCELPCWWGITPGETTWTEARTKLEPLGRWSGPWGDDGIGRYDFVFDMPEEIDPLGFFEPSLGVKSDVVTGISLCGSWIKQDFDYSLAGFLQTFGPPDEIWLKVVTETQESPYYEISIFYPSKGVLLGASGTVDAQSDHLMICPQEFKLGAFPPGVLLWSPRKQLTYANIFLAVLGQENMDMSDYHLLEEWSLDFDREGFYATYLDSQTSTCFEVVPIVTTE